MTLAIVDPPYNIGFDYGDGGYVDSMPADQYLAWAEQWLRQIHRVLTAAGSLWLVIGDELVSEIDVLAKRLGFFKRSHVIWHYTFGVNSAAKLTRSHAHLLYLTKSRRGAVFYPEQVRVPSARAVVYKDKRASPRGRLPDDTWILRPSPIEDAEEASYDTWYDSRVCGTFGERVQGAANQLPESLVGRIIRLCSRPGGFVLDPMMGVGTVPAVAKKLGRSFIGCELVSRFYQLAVARVAAAQVGDALGGVSTTSR